MISNERPSPYGFRPPMPPRPPVPEATLKYERVEIEHKSFVFMLKENLRGRFLRITEKSADGFTCLIIPASGLEAFNQLLEQLLKAAKKRPSAVPPAAGQPLKAEQLQVERKNFEFVLDEDPRGRFLAILEKNGSHSNELIIPASGLEIFNHQVSEMVAAANSQPVPPATGTEVNTWPPSVEETLKSGQMQLERRAFTFMLKKNAHGRFLRITTEEKEGRYNSLIIPAEGLEEFKKLVVEMAKASKKLKD